MPARLLGGSLGAHLGGPSEASDWSMVNSLPEIVYHTPSIEITIWLKNKAEEQAPLTRRKDGEHLSGPTEPQECCIGHSLP